MVAAFDLEYFHEHWIQVLNCDCIAAEVAAPRKNIYPVLGNHLRAPPFPSNCAEDDFRSKMSLSITVKKAE